MSLLKKMLLDLPFSPDELHTLIRTAPYRYKVYRIPKRQPNQYRTIAQPSSEIKLLQRWLINEVLSNLPVHKAATAYRRGKSIADHAAIHAGKRFLLKMDFQDFFPSISSDDIQRHLIQFGKMSLEDARLTCQIVSWLDKSSGSFCLSIGAPSSPLLSNSMLYTFDKKVLEVLRGKKISYSRYADDLAFSTDRPDVLGLVAKDVLAICKSLEYPRLKIKHSKTVSVSRASNKTLVGLVLTSTGEVSLGREKKRRIRSEIYRFTRGLIEKDEVARLRGEIAFAWSIEKTYVLSLLRQFGKEVFEKLDLPFGSTTDLE